MVTCRLKMLVFQLTTLAAGAVMTPTVSAMAKGVPPAAGAVQIGNFTFKSPVVTVPAGTTITWTNGDDIPHTVVSKDGLFKSKVLDSGDHFSFTFAKPGQFGYYCSLHPHMTGMIIVKA